MSERLKKNKIKSLPKLSFHKVAKKFSNILGKHEGEKAKRQKDETHITNM